MTDERDESQAGAQQRAKDQWQRRQETLGDSPRAVLMKGVPDAVNDGIDQWHRAVLRMAFQQRVSGCAPVLDIGCGYGRLATEAGLLGLRPVVGVDLSIGFCKHFAAAHGNAVLADVSRLPFAADTFGNAYGITVLMYLDAARARSALQSLDACLAPRARVLLLEPGAEFNRIVRFFIRSKSKEDLARPGFTDSEFHCGIVPADWRLLGRGSNMWMTLLLPLLFATAPVPRLNGLLGKLARFLDRPRLAMSSRRLGRLALYRWAVYETQAGGGAEGDLRSSQTYPGNDQ